MKKMSNLNPIFENILVSHGMKKSEKEFTTGDLVMVRLNNGIKDAYRQPHYNVWLRVKFIDNDSTFIGEIEKKTFEYIQHEKGEQIRLNVDKVAEVYNENDGQQWCYSDDVTRCNCKGLCRNK